MKQVAIITGAANNIGLAIAKRFTADFKVVGLDRVFQSQNDSDKKNQLGFEQISCDITKPAEVEAAFALARNIGPIGVVINSAAITGPRTSIVETSIESWRQVIDVNLNGAFIVMKSAYAYLKETQGCGLLISFNTRSKR